MKISTKTTIEVVIDGKTFPLTKSEAQDLYEQLKRELGIVDLSPIIPWKQKEHIGKHQYTPPLPNPMPPYNPTPIWCQQPTSTCNI